MTPTINKCYAIAGRLPGSDEDTIICYTDTTVEKAKLSFRVDMHDGMSEADKIALFEWGGTDLYISAVLSSDTPITVDES